MWISSRRPAPGSWRTPAGRDGMYQRDAKRKGITHTIRTFYNRRNNTILSRFRHRAVTSYIRTLVYPDHDATDPGENTFVKPLFFFLRFCRFFRIVFIFSSIVHTRCPSRRIRVATRYLLLAFIIYSSSCYPYNTDDIRNAYDIIVKREKFTETIS